MLTHAYSFDVQSINKLGGYSTLSSWHAHMYTALQYCSLTFQPIIYTPLMHHNTELTIKISPCISQ